jgi:thermostable 8-oxoguanine DNA glycosylase
MERISDVSGDNMTEHELQLRLLYAIIVAGKSAKFAEQAMNKLFTGLGDKLPFDIIKSWITENCLEAKLHIARVGNYHKSTKAFTEVATINMDLKNCQPEDLETIYGIGPKTARFFIIWTRPEARVAALDVHILRWLKSIGYNAPRQTPSGKKYSELEKAFISEADKRNLTPRQLDAQIWSAGSQYDQKVSFDIISKLIGENN